MRRPSQTLRNSLWAFGAQGLTVVMQFGYAAFASRMADPTAFGIYSTGLLITSLVAILSVGGIGQSVARSKASTLSELRGLASFGVLLGVAASIVTIAAVALIAVLLGSSYLQPLLLCGIAAFVAPSAGLLSGVLRQRNDFRGFAYGTITAFAASLALSASLVFLHPSALTLLVAPVSQQVFLYLLFQLRIRRPILPGRVGPEVRRHISFSWRVSASNLLAYGIENATRFATLFAVGAPSLGRWNRADVVTTIPFDRMQTSLMLSLYAKFSDDAEQRLEPRRWSDLITLCAWVSLPAAFVVAGLAPTLVPFILGEQWASIGGIATILAVGAGMRGPSVQLASACEAAGRFRWLWATYAALLAMQLIAGAIVVSTGSYLAAIWAAVLVPTVRLGMLAWIAGHSGLLERPRLAIGIAEALLMATTVGLGARTAAEIGSGPTAIHIAAAASAIATFVYCILAGRNAVLRQILGR